ncbi:MULTISPECIES: ABC transporter permease subunit [Staphylococcus]|uniref:ABC transporter permease n=1 Tax=Staphylococcus TaxID=1279 RepID=UPI000E698AA1|nr:MULTISPECIES: ABC transporter permease subunit [Staphylococcus]MDW8553044.1 ABC transporter permease subunit [Staphylococcus nepalensis]RIO42200.1 hypothetical protein BUZ60_08520 [Staphylococcus nepalensis]WQL20069.1 ABC transporter permease subunit [Staphylococcus nepalensis]
MNTTRLSALLEKDLKEAIRNPSIIFMPIIILFVSFFYSFIMSEIGNATSATILMQFIVVNMAFVMVATATIITMFAEENEKGTLKGLIETPASKVEILLSKAIIMKILTIITTILSLLILGSSIHFGFQTYIGLVIMLFFYLILGLTLGLLSNSTGAATTYTMLPFFIFGMIPLFEMMKDVLDLGFFEKVLNWLPFGLVLELETNHATLTLIYLMIWLIVSIITLTFVYDYKFRKR